MKLEAPLINISEEHLLNLTTLKLSWKKKSKNSNIVLMSSIKLEKMSGVSPGSYCTRDIPEIDLEDPNLKDSHNRMA